MKKCLLAALFTGAFSLAFGQSEPTLHFMTNWWQANQTNPAFWPDEQINIGLPALSNTLFFTGATYGDALVEQNGETVLDVDQLISQLEDRNLVRENLRLETISAGFRLGKFHLGISHAVRFHAFLDYPKTLPQLIWQGNAQFIGQEIDLGHDFQIGSFNEFGVTGAYTLGPLTAGARVKWLTGLGDLSTEKGQASLYTAPEIYQLSFETDYLLHTSSVLDYNSYTDFEFDANFGQLDLSRLITRNSGWAFDFGVNIELEKLRLSASVVDLGSIRWTENVTNYSSQASVNYDGLDISLALTGDSVSLQEALDTLEQILVFDSTQNNYSTALPAKVYLSGGYEITPSLTVGAGLFGEWYREQFFPAGALNVQWRVLRWLQIGATYTVYRNTFFNFGVSGAVRLGPVQVFLLTDNLPAAFNPAGSRFFSARAGLNLAFGARTE